MNHPAAIRSADGVKFRDPDYTAEGLARAKVGLVALETLWFNTGTLCNIECANCYILSSPTNDALVYLTPEDVRLYLDEVAEASMPVREIGFTGGEPFMNPNMVELIEMSLCRGFEVLVLTNAMRPMLRPSILRGLENLSDRSSALTFRVSLDHHSAALHDQQRGRGAFAQTLSGMRWLHEHGFRLAIAGRTMWGETERQSRDGFARLIREEGFRIDAADPAQLVLFPEMDEGGEVPEISTACWQILDRRPDSVMCANSRMVVRRRGADGPVVLACTLLAYDSGFELGATLAEASRPVALNHPHCARFCVLGGARCSG